ncbi:MAG TPA: aminotransferase class I/II-fold pyridoxal phosphate-dependent enzyme, partial [Tepidisphaeraceae bacterium]|nr:aminotransferase class I/II-fold pyridoxal phosphate-dependent enzyme [Tepidisphaeraceae bacterium]
MAPPTFVRANVRAMSGHAPGEQPDGQRVIKLNTNENPYPPSPRVLEAIREIDAETLRKYPQPQADAFRASAAKLWNIKPEMILAGNGSEDIFTIATRCFVPPGGIIASPTPSYSLYPVLAQLADATHVGVAWKKNWQLPIDALTSSNAQAIYLCNPNTPSGTLVSSDDIESLLKETKSLVLVNEAYADFSGESVIELVEKFENLVVARSLSKGYSLAGLRFGYAVAQAQVIEQMMKVKDSYNCDAISIVAATAALEDQAHAQAGWKNVREERERVSSELRR